MEKLRIVEELCVNENDVYAIVYGALVTVCTSAAESYLTHV